MPATPGVVERDTPESVLLRRRARRRPQGRASTALPEAFREAVWLRDVEDLSVPGDRRRAGGADRHRDVADLPRPRGSSTPLARARRPSPPRHGPRNGRAGMSVEFPSSLTATVARLKSLLPPFVDGEASAARARPVVAAPRRAAPRAAGGAGAARCAAPALEPARRRCASRRRRASSLALRRCGRGAGASHCGRAWCGAVGAGGRRRAGAGRDRRRSAWAHRSFVGAAGRAAHARPHQVLPHRRRRPRRTRSRADGAAGAPARRRSAWSVPMPGARGPSPACTWSACAGASTARAWSRTCSTASHGEPVSMFVMPSRLAAPAVDLVVVRPSRRGA